MFLNYQKFMQLLSAETGYSGEVQVVLTEENLKEKILLLISAQGNLSPDKCRALCLNEYSDLRESVVQDGTLLLDVRAVNPDHFERTAGSGKLIRVIDRRNRA